MKPVLIGLYSSDMRSGKSTVGHMLTERFFGVTVSFAAPFYDFVIGAAAHFVPGGESEVRAWLADDRKDNAIIPVLGVTLRFLLQRAPTWGRTNFDPSLWTLIGEQKALKALKSYSVIIDDMRFPDEFSMIKRNGGKCIRIHRPGVGSRGDTGIGEGLLDNHDFDFDIYNEHSLEDLKKNVWYVADLIKPKACCHKTVVQRCNGCPYA